MNKSWILFAYLFGLLSLCFSTQASAYGPFGQVIWLEYAEAPSYIEDQVEDGNPNYTGDSFICYDADTFAIINCTYTMNLVGQEDQSDPQVQFTPPLTDIQLNGGHDPGYHPQPQPFYLSIPTTNVLTVVPGSGDYTQVDSFTVVGNSQQGSLYGWSEVDFPVSDVAGSLWLEINIQFPFGYICIYTCYTYDSVRIHETDLVGLFTDNIPGANALQLLPATDPNDPTPDYVEVRGLGSPPSGDPGHGGHPQTDSCTDSECYENIAAWGTPYTLQQLLIIANLYRDVTPWHGKLSVNDISLPEGGLFDIHDDWSTPHQDHRLGRAFDVNRTDGSNVFEPCDSYGMSDYPFPSYLQIMAEEQDFVSDIGPNPYTQLPAVHCESGGRYHLNINVYVPTVQNMQQFQ